MTASSSRAMAGAPSHSIFASTAAASLAAACRAACASSPIHDSAGARPGV